ncbi:MAG: hypothetical protein AB7P20_09240 [Rhizobiaceae bacterium]
MLKRIIALFYALARLTDRLDRRSRPVRCLVLWILKPAVAIALDCIADAGPVHQALIWVRTDSIVEAKRYSRCFRTAARSIKRQFKALDRCEAYEDGDPILLNRPPHFAALSGRRFTDLLASLRNLASAQAGLLHSGLAPTLLPEPRDTS